MPWALVPYAGVLSMSDSELDGVGMTLDSSAIFGARLGYRFARHWSFEASYGYAPLSAAAEGFGDVDGRLHLYHAGFHLIAPAEGAARLLLYGGAGAVHYSYDEFERQGVLLQDESWAHELLVTLGAGVEVDAGERFAFRADVKDHVQFCRAEDEPIVETEDFSHCPLDDTVLHNPELSGGVVIRF